MTDELQPAAEVLATPDVTAPDAEKAPKAPKVKKEPTGPVCSICNKPLTDPESVKRGVGPFCQNLTDPEKMKLLEETLASRTVDKLPDGYVAIPAVFKAVDELDLAAGTRVLHARLFAAIGGDHCAKAPWADCFAYLYLGNRKFVPQEALSTGLELLQNEEWIKAHEPVRVRTAPVPKERKPRAKKAASQTAAEIIAEAQGGADAPVTLKKNKAVRPPAEFVDQPLVWGENPTPTA